MDTLLDLKVIALALSGDATSIADIIGTLMLLFSAPLIVIELGWMFMRRAMTRTRVKEMFASYSTVPLGLLTQGIAYAIWFAVYIAFSEFAFFHIPSTLGAFAVCLILTDLMYYWDHRLGHQIQGLWALYHSVHHSSPMFDQSTSFRISFADQFVVPLFYLPLVLLGFDPKLVVACQVIVLAYQGWIHTEMVGKLGVLDLIVNTPSTHRVHHAAQPDYRDKNFGGILMVWDHLFGTYQAETTAPAYGLVDPIKSINLLDVYFCELRRLKTKREAVHPKRSWLMFLLGRP